MDYQPLFNKLADLGYIETESEMQEILLIAKELYTMNKYRVEYQFNSARFSFSNSVTVVAENKVTALLEAQKEVAECYGADMLKKFTYKEPIEL